MEVTKLQTHDKGTLRAPGTVGAVGATRTRHWQLADFSCPPPLSAFLFINVNIQNLSLILWDQDDQATAVGIVNGSFLLPYISHASGLIMKLINL